MLHVLLLVPVGDRHRDRIVAWRQQRQVEFEARARDVTRGELERFVVRRKKRVIAEDVLSQAVADQEADDGAWQRLDRFDVDVLMTAGILNLRFSF